VESDGRDYHSTDVRDSDEAVQTGRSEDTMSNTAICDGNGRLSRIEMPNGEVKEYFYHPNSDKISTVVTDDVSTVFTYNKTGELSRIYNTLGQLITLSYDSHKRIQRMIEINENDRTHRELIFHYNAQGKPIIIIMVGKGEIRVRYDSQGEISDVKSKQGVKMALAVAEAFQMLLNTVKVADTHN
jgi:hypothetical protein